MGQGCTCATRSRSCILTPGQAGRLLIEVKPAVHYIWYLTLIRFVQDVTDLRVLSRTYMEMLRDLSPPLNASSRWSATRERIRSDPRFKVVSFFICHRYIYVTQLLLSVTSASALGSASAATPASRYYPFKHCG
jgi:FF domain